jgi:hypothetical protein
MPSINYSVIGDLVVPLYAVGKRREPVLLGSAAPLVIGSQHLLVTAAHVLDGNDDTVVGDAASSLYLSIEGRLTELTAAPAFKSPLPPSGRREDDAIDLAFIAIPGGIASGLGPVRFLKPRNLGINDHLSSSGSYVFSGYPETKNRTKFGTNALKPFCLAYTGRSVPAAEAGNPEMADRTHIVVRFDRSRVFDTDGNRLTPPEPFGMSGGAVWAPAAADPNEPVLVGIGTEYRAKSKLLIGTRINVVVAAVLSKYPHLNSLVPAIEGLHINFRSEETAGV